MNQKSKTIIFTGGHHNSALLVAKALKAKGYRILWLGHLHSSKSDANVSQEYRDVMAADITFINLRSGKIHNEHFWQLIKTISSFLFCVSLFLKERPSLVVSFGGYLAVPPVIAAKILAIPSVSHEQTTVMGMANKTILPLVKTMYLTWPIAKYMQSKKVKLVGLPQSFQAPAINSVSDLNSLLSNQKPPMLFVDTQKPFLVISGGKQGAHAVNELIERALIDLLPKWNILHQCGSNMATRDFQRLIRRRQRLPFPLENSYAVVEYIPHFQDVIKLADLVIGRSGAHTTMEILQLGKKMIAIPLPHSYCDEQEKNANKLVEAGIAEILLQSKANPQELVRAVDRMYNLQIDGNRLREMQNQLPKDALDVMVADIEKIIS